MRVLLKDGYRRARTDGGGVVRPCDVCGRRDGLGISDDGADRKTDARYDNCNLALRRKGQPMKVRIALFLAGIVLGSATTGVAATHGLPWSKTQGPYLCNGNDNGVNCQRRYSPWKVLVSKQNYPAVAIFYGDKPVFGCGRFEWPEDCYDHRP